LRLLHLFAASLGFSFSAFQYVSVSVFQILFHAHRPPPTANFFDVSLSAFQYFSFCSMPTAHRLLPTFLMSACQHFSISDFVPCPLPTDDRQLFLFQLSAFCL
jgi:hypothetical protein